MSKEPKSFTPNEVAALVERLESKFRVVAEGQTALGESMDEVKERLASVETRLEAVEDAVRVAIPGHEKRLATLEAKVSK